METVNQENMTPETEQTEQNTERTFSQADVDRIVADRLQRERQKYVDYDVLKEKVAQFDELETTSKKETERADALQEKLDQLTAANAERDLREKIAGETGVPSSLLHGSDEEDLRSQAAAILGFADARKSSYPVVKDGGEVHAPTITREEILGIKDEKKRLEAIKEHIDLF